MNGSFRFPIGFSIGDVNELRLATAIPISRLPEK